METKSINVQKVAHVIGQLVDQISDEDAIHSKRIAVMAWRVGRQMGLPAQDLQTLYTASLIHDCGVNSPEEHSVNLRQLRWDTEGDHCIRGGHYIDGCTVLKSYASIVRHHHAPWSSLQFVDIPMREKVMANIIHCVDRAFVGFFHILTDHGFDMLVVNKNQITDVLRDLGTDAIHPDVLTAFHDVAKTDAFWFSLHKNYIDTVLAPANAMDGHIIDVNIRQMRNVATLISRLVDTKSKFTHDHSERVAFLATHLAAALSLDTETIDKLEIAALLHDVGKQEAPEYILLKPGKLDEVERAIIKRHAIGTEVSLNLLFPGSRMVQWASQHHEKLDGSGYPYGLGANDLDICSRILTVSDIFQALTQNRPYRGRMAVNDAIDIMDGMCNGGEIDPDVFGALKADRAFYYSVSAE